MSRLIDKSEIEMLQMIKNKLMKRIESGEVSASVGLPIQESLVMKIRVLQIGVAIN